MNFLALQQTVRDAIAANALFAADAATHVLKDNGASKAALEQAFTDGKGWTVAVWPAARGVADQDEDKAQGAKVTTVVRLCVNPQKLKALRQANQSDGEFINTALAAIIASVIGLPPGNDQLRFQMDPDCFELISFDEGMIAYHIRFARFVVFGT